MWQITNTIRFFSNYIYIFFTTKEPPSLVEKQYQPLTLQGFANTPKGENWQNSSAKCRSSRSWQPVSIQGRHFAVQRKIYYEISINKLFFITMKNPWCFPEQNPPNGSTRRRGKSHCRRDQSICSNTGGIKQISKAGDCQTQAHRIHE